MAYKIVVYRSWLKCQAYKVLKNIFGIVSHIIGKNNRVKNKLWKYYKLRYALNFDFFREGLNEYFKKEKLIKYFDVNDINTVKTDKNNFLKVNNLDHVLKSLTQNRKHSNFHLLKKSFDNFQSGKTVFTHVDSDRLVFCAWLCKSSQFKEAGHNIDKSNKTYITSDMLFKSNKVQRNSLTLR